MMLSYKLCFHHYSSNLWQLFITTWRATTANWRIKSAILILISNVFQAASEANLGTESVTSSDFDKFLAERAAAADTLPNANANTNLPTPRHRQINKEEQDSMFAL